MKWIAIAMLVVSACDDDEMEGTDSGVDAGMDASVEAGVQALVAGSLAKWNALEAAAPGPYWYEEENCRAGSVQGASTFVQVEGGSGRAVGGRSFPLSECRARVNRYDNLMSTLPSLHQACANLLARRTGVTVRLDGEGVLQGCWIGEAPNCRDNCGEGFYLRARGFGTAPVSDAGTDGGS